MKNRFLLPFVFVLFFSAALTSTLRACNSSVAYNQQTICQGTSYSFDGHMLTTAGTYNDTIVLSGGCDSIISLQLFVIPTVYSYISGQLCPGSGGYNFFGQTLTQAGTYYDTLFAPSTFCDSVIVLTLTSGTTSPSYTVYGSLCNGNPYYFYGNYYYYSGYYSVTVNNPTGCDTTVYLDLSDYYNYTTYVAGYSCSSQPYYYDGKTYSVPGYYYDTLTSVGGCDSMIYLELFATNYNDVSFGTCDSTYTYLGHTYRVPGQYNDTITYTGACDSIISIDLYKNTTGNTTYLYYDVCTVNYLYNGKSYPVPGYYYDTLTSVAGCDSLIYLELYSNIPYSYVDITTCNSQYVYNGTVYYVPGYYTDTLSSSTGCDSLIYLDLSYGNPYTYLDYNICSNQFLYNGTSYPVPGYYTITFLTSAGCDSFVYLDLYSNSPYSYQTFYVCNSQPFIYNGNSYAVPGYYIDTLVSAGGCDSLVYLDLYSGNPYSYQTIYTCTSTYLYNGQFYSVPGYYDVTLVTPSSCDSTVYLDLYEGNPYSYATFYTCLSQYSYNGKTYAVPGYYTDTLISAGGCDSMIYLSLFSGNPGSTVSVSACSNQPYTYNGHSYTVPGSYIDTLVASSGCDSIIYLQLSSDNPYKFITDYACPSEPYSYNGHLYAVPGYYTDTFTTSGGCDSFVYLRLYNTTLQYGYQTVYTCNNPYISNGHQFAVPGFYYDTLKYASGCDSAVVELYLYSSTYDYIYLNDNGCAGSLYNFRGKNYVLPDYYYNYYDIYDTVASSTSSCDTLFDIELYLVPAPVAYVSDSFCQGSTYHFGGYSFTTAGYDTLYMPGPVGTCDTILYLYLTYKAGPAIPTVSQSGSFLIAVAPTDLQYEWLLNGSPVPGGNTQVLSITQNGTYNIIVTDSGSTCAARSADVYVTDLGISSTGGNLLYQLSPNPNTGRFTLNVPGFSGVGLWIYDVFGREIYQKQLSRESETIDVEAAEGTYILMLKGNGCQAVTKFVITR